MSEVFVHCSTFYVGRKNWADQTVRSSAVSPMLVQLVVAAKRKRDGTFHNGTSKRMPVCVRNALVVGTILRIL